MQICSSYIYPNGQSKCKETCFQNYNNYDIKFMVHVVQGDWSLYMYNDVLYVSVTTAAGDVHVQVY